MFYKGLVRRALFTLSEKDPERAHEFVMRKLQTLSRHPHVLHMVQSMFDGGRDSRLEQEICGIHFPNPIGLAAGFDKNCVALEAFQALGFGFIEAGTVIRDRQEGNPRPRIFRIKDERALINRMGFPSDGAEVVRTHLMKRGSLDVPLGISIGKSKSTPIHKAIEEYCELFEMFYPYADYFAVNISSPNTPRLRTLQDRGYVDELLAALKRSREKFAERRNFGKGVPIFFKIAPDLTTEAIDDLLDVFLGRDGDGLIVGNTSIDRTLTRTRLKEAGGLSGPALQRRAREIVAHIRRCSSSLPIIAVGGISFGDDAYLMFEHGASLVQIYTSFIYEGPFVVRDILKRLSRIMDTQHLWHMSEVARRQV